MMHKSRGEHESEEEASDLHQAQVKGVPIRSEIVYAEQVQDHQENHEDGDSVRRPGSNYIEQSKHTWGE